MERLTKATLLKLLLAETLADRYDKILYLDADVTIHEELNPIFSLHTKGYPLAAVPSGAQRTGHNWPRRQSQAAHFRALGMTEPYRFVNSGVMLIDVSQWNRDDLSARSLDFIRRNPTLWRLPDEDALNAILDGHLAELSPVWNMQAPIWSHREVRANVQPAIIHYVGPNKPWKRFRRRKGLFEHRAAYRLYQAFIARSPWTTWLDEQWGARDLWDSLAFEMHRINRMIGVRKIRKSRNNRRAFLDTYRQHCGETAFADVEQGIVRREGVRLRINNSSQPPPDRSNWIAGDPGEKRAEAQEAPPTAPRSPIMHLDPEGEE
jgi:lipopolysaccharide biosynthesis glycosyltransferase